MTDRVIMTPTPVKKTPEHFISISHGQTTFTINYFTRSQFNYCLFLHLLSPGLPLTLHPTPWLALRPHSTPSITLLPRMFSSSIIAMLTDSRYVRFITIDVTEYQTLASSNGQYPFTHNWWTVLKDIHN